MNEPLQSQDSKVKDLIALKRFEVPPPGHQELLSSKIISRLESEQLRARQPWFRRWMHAFDVNPFLTTVYGSVVMALLFVGWNYGEHFESDSQFQSFGNAGLWIVPAGTAANDEIIDWTGRGNTIFGTLEVHPIQGSSSIQPQVHIPSIPIPGLNKSMTIPSVDDTSAY